MTLGFDINTAFTWNPAEDGQQKGHREKYKQTNGMSGQHNQMRMTGVAMMMLIVYKEWNTVYWI